MIKSAELVTFNFEPLGLQKSDIQHDPNKYIRSIASFVIKLMDKRNIEILLNPAHNTITWTTKSSGTFSSA